MRDGVKVKSLSCAVNGEWTESVSDCEGTQQDVYYFYINKQYYYPYRAFCGQNKIEYSRFVTRRAIFF